MTNERLSFDPEYRLEVFDSKSFDLFYATWSEVLTRDDDGNYLPPAEALDMLRQAHLAVQNTYSLSIPEANLLASIACQYACTLPIELEHEITE